MIVQIYEVTTPAEARALGAMGVDHIGVLVGDGSFPREQTIEKAREIFAAIEGIGIVAFSRPGSHCADHSRAAARHPASRRSATASLASPGAEAQSRISANIIDAEHTGS